MVTEELRTLVQNVAKVTKETNTSIEETIELLESDYYMLLETDDSNLFRATAKKIVSEMNFSLNSKLYYTAVEVLCIAYEQKRDTYKRLEIAKELAKRFSPSEVNFYNSLSTIMFKFALYLSGKDLYSFVYRHSRIDTDKVLKILVSYIEDTFKSKKNE